MQRQAREQGEGEPIDGKAFAAGLRQRTGKGLAALVAKGGARSRLATALVCAEPASQVYMRAARASWRPSSACTSWGARDPARCFQTRHRSCFRRRLPPSRYL